MFVTLRNYVLKAFLLLTYIGLLILHLAVPINLTAVDIGRHIKNGELVLRGNFQVLYKNFYSFTYPDYPFINHHWLFGLLSYSIFHLSGFKGLSVFYIGLLIMSFLIAFDSARRYSNFTLAFFSSVVGFLFLISRPEIRPEGVSVFFVALDFWLLQGLGQRRLSPLPVMVAIPVIQILWVNTHIFFLLGPLLVGLFYWQAQWASPRKADLELWRRLLIVTTLVNLINPSGLGGMLTPLNGFKKFGYELAENQTVFFMMHRFNMFTYKYYLLMALLMVVGMIMALRRDGRRGWPLVILGALITLAGFRAVRLFMPFGFLSIPLMAYFYSSLIKTKVVNLLLGISSVCGLCFCMLFFSAHPSIGLSPNVNGSAEFYQQSGLKGPIFSNYDIGGYLIYHLADKEKVFVDNRQEAFPPEFFKELYVPMQEDAAVWRRALDHYGFNVIFFYRHDLTPWGQDFMIARVRDPQWAPVFVDDYSIIFAKRGSIDQAVIDRFELPTSIFRVASMQ